jgi:hypothetical protein
MGDRNKVQRHPRQSVSLFVGLGEADQSPARSRNLSVSGLFLETASRPPVGSIVTLWFVWGEDTFITKAKVIRHDSDGLGLTFVDAESPFLGALAEILGLPEPRPA